MISPHHSAAAEAVDSESQGSADGNPSADGGLRQRLCDARRAKGLTQQQVADKLGVSRRAVSEWERGLRQPHFALPELAELYEVSAMFLLYGVEPANVELQKLRDDVAALREELHEKYRELYAEVLDAQKMVTMLAETVSDGFGMIRAVFEARERERKWHDDG